MEDEGEEGKQREGKMKRQKGGDNGGLEKIRDIRAVEVRGEERR